MEKRRYTIEANIATLARFAQTAATGGNTAAFITKMTVSKDEDYYYVTVLAEQSVHGSLRTFFTNSDTVR